LPNENTAAIFDGHWKLDQQASDDVKARLMPLFERDDRHWRRIAERFEDQPSRPDSGSEGGDDGISNMRWMQHERQKEVQTLIAQLMPATRLDIQHVDRSIRFATDKGEGTRVLTPGETSTLFLEVGAFVVSSSWEKGGLLIELRGSGENRLRIVQRFKLHGAQLDEQLEVKIPTIGKHSFHFVYKQ
jgi:hypothetical protein